ncbi:MAG: GEVED domain-containing protein, partial [Bacteroidota bacterium]
GTITNTSTITNSPPAYFDYTAYSTNVNAGSPYSVNVRYSDNGSPVNYGKIAVWIDFNGDLDFLDANEFIGQLQATATNQIKTFNFTVPANAYNGSVVMRVRCAYDDEGFTSTDPCSTRDYGETEDYTLNIANLICISPTLTAKANNVIGTTTECSGASVTLTANPIGGSGCLGSWEYTWTDGTNYWNGTSFSSVTALWNTSYSTITVPSVISTATYTAHVECSADGACNDQSSVTVNVLGAPASCTAVIGNPANGTAHHMSISWTSLTGADGYELQYSTNGTSWASLYTGTALTYDHNCSDNPNVSYYYKVRAFKGTTYCSYTNCTQYPIYTACDVPAVPSIVNATSNTLDLTLIAETPVANPAITTFSIYCTATAEYVQADGTLGATEVYQTKSAWGTVVVNGLTATTQYCFYAKAKNFDGDVRYSSGTSILPLEQFTTSTNFSNGSSTTTKYWSPSTCSSGALVYSSTGGCTDGNIGKTGSWNNYFGCFVRTPQANCTGNTSVTLNFDISNSYFSAHPNDKTRFYMWVDGGYKNASNVKIGGIDVGYTDINGLWLKFDQSRTCVNVDVIFDLTTCTNLSNILFYIEPNCGYNDSYVFSVVLDNISMAGAIPSTCGTTLATSPLTAGSIAESQSVCTGGDPAAFSQTPASGGTGPITYQWQSTTVSGCASGWSDISGATSATYNIPSGITQTTCFRREATDGITTLYSNTVTITVNPIPTANAGADIIVCRGGNTTLDASGGSSYFWSPSTGLSATNISNPVATPPATITYNVTVSSGGCSASDDVTVTVFGGYIIENDTVLCQSDIITYNATTNIPAYTYSWNTGSTASSIMVMPSQTTTFTVTISDGITTCDDSVTVTISDIQTSAVTGADTVIQNYTESYSVTQNAGSTYLWQVNGGTVQSGAGTNSVNILWTSVGNGLITVIETDTYGCQDTATLAVHVDLNTGIGEYIGSFVSVMPNPVNDIVYVINNEVDDAIMHMSLSDITGRLVFSKDELISQKEMISVSKLKEGMYFLELSTQMEKHIVVRVVVCR